MPQPERGHPKQVKGFLLEELDDELLLHHPGRTAVLRLNETAALVWRLCDGERTADDIASLVSSAYPDSGNRVAVQVAETLKTLIKHSAVSVE